jgi:hypothetical protein
MRNSMRALVVILVTAAPAAAQTAAVHPLYAEMPGSMRNAEAQRLFGAAAARQGLGPVEVMDIAGPPAARGPELLKTGMAAAEKLRFAEAERALDEAVAEVEQRGAGAFSEGQLADLFLHQAIAAQKANWKELEGPLGDLAPKVKQAYLRAAVLAPARVLEAHHYPPLAIASFAQAAAEVNQRPRGNIVVHATPAATISIDARPWQTSPATATALPYGEHFVRVDDVGHAVWAAVVNLSSPTLEVQAPGTAALVPDDAEAAGHARRMGARFALLGALVLGEQAALAVRLVDADTSAVVDTAVVPLGGDAGVLEATVMRLCAEARKPAEAPGVVPLAGPVLAPVAPPVPALASPPSDSHLTEEPGTWARRNWPVLTVVGVMLATGIVLTLATASEPRLPR